MTEKTQYSDTPGLITLQIGEQELTFAPTPQAYDTLQNDFMPNNKVAPLKNYLRRIVINDHRQALDTLLQKPGMPAAIASAVNDEYAPNIEIIVKK
ncbi:putative phage tail assembly chaperone [Edwardsiella ictaluri]|uniref:putative phage tail assembly chaperone n=1 Tax=Edwardsiella ictaluri TaxID=67780 RepID=UPI0039F6BCE3